MKRKVNFQQNPHNTSYTSVCCSTTLRNLEVHVLAYLEETANENVTCINF